MDGKFLEKLDYTATVTPAWQILDALPDECKECTNVLPKVDSMAFWVSEGRTTGAKAARLLLEQAGCAMPGTE